MKIQPIKQLINNNISFNKRSKEKPIKYENNSALKKSNLWEIAKHTIEQTKLEDSIEFQKFTMKKGHVDVQEYKQLKEHIRVILKAYNFIDKNYIGDITPTMSAKIASLTKKYLDIFFTHHKYRIISIGTSPAPITQPLKILGCDVIHVPMSGLKDFNENETEKNIDIAMQYAKLKGLDDKKINVITDFSATGKSFAQATKLFAKYFPDVAFWNMTTQNLIYDGVKTGIYEKSLDDIEEEEIVKSFKNDMYNSSCELISNVPHFYINDVLNYCTYRSIGSKGKKDEEIFKKFDEFSTILGRCFELCTIHELDKLGLIE